MTGQISVARVALAFRWPYATSTLNHILGFTITTGARILCEDLSELVAPTVKAGFVGAVSNAFPS